MDRGESIRRARPDRVVAQVIPSTAAFPPEELRPIELAKGKFVVPDDFDDPLPDDIIDAFYNGSIYPNTSPGPVL